ncbi:uncharacterized protein [Anabrus simplex]
MFQCLPGIGHSIEMKLVHIITKRSFRSCVVRTVKNYSKSVLSDTGKDIKQLNKENKALFGKLLETRKQKRKKTLKTLNTNAFQSDIKSDFSSELWWWKASSPKRTITLRVNWKNPNLKQEKETVPRSTHAETVSVYPEFKGNAKREVGCIVNLSSSETRVLCRPNYPTTENPIGKGDRSARLALANVSEDVSQFNVNELGFFEKCQDQKTNPVKFPAIIIRHITTFPLQNNKRNLLDWSDSDTNLLHISADDGNSCKNKSFFYPSVTKILNATMSESSRSALERWKQKMILQLGCEGFAAFQKDLLDQGSKFHAAVQSFLSGSPAVDLDLEPSIEGCWESVRYVLPDLTDVRVLESHVVHPYLKYRGVIDCVAQYCGKPVIIEWKRSDRKKPELANTYDAPVQLCAYLGAMNYDENYHLKVKGGLVVVAYSDGSPANTFKLNVADCNKYWEAWLVRLQKYWMLQNQG